MSIVSRLDLKGAQQTAAELLDTHLAVTAGAGAGKTRVLVGRYLHWIEKGLPVRSLIAITFTEKAAREMRSRIRREIEELLAESGANVLAGPWQSAYIELDSAPIGTIHALCADLLRLYPAEAGVDPRFAVIEEDRAAMLRAQAIEAGLAWAATETEATRLFAAFKEDELRRALATLLNQRLDAAPALRRPDPLVGWEAALRQRLSKALDRPEWSNALQALAENRGRQNDDKLEVARAAVLAYWNEVQNARAGSDWDRTLAAVSALRGATSVQGQQKNWEAGALEAVRDAMKSLRGLYDQTLGPLIPKDGVRWALDQEAAQLYPALGRLFNRALAEYEALKDAALGLDFDDLEGRAAQLLGSVNAPSVAEQPRALLVDEFQDTNARQRQIVYALAGLAPMAAGATLAPRAGRVRVTATKNVPTANLFIVGDAKQSIYGFRGADVTVFRGIQADIAQAGGQVIDLGLTFRAHAPLLKTIARLLAPLMGETDDPGRPYHVPFAPLSAYRPQPRAGVQAPFVEFQIGLGDAVEGRRAAAAALAARLHQLHASEDFAWQHMALLFRASSAFPVYEEALEAAGIPYVTVAGEGFYDRPEIRDLLNALSAIADPSDDLTMAGLLRSPAFALGDADLYRLRFPAGSSEPHSIYQSLVADPAFSAVAQTITHLNTLSGRLPIAELLKAFIDLTHYRAILKSGSGGQRLSRNVDKLLADAHRSRLVAVGDFVDYIRTLRDVGAREGEAPAEVGGAVQLMTIHKSKGLEFPLVVIADAAHAGGGRGGDSVALDPALGILLKLTADKARPVGWQLGSLAKADREEAEDLRLLYVAATRAQEKIICSGHAHISPAKDGPARLKLTGWLALLGQVVGLDKAQPADEVEAPQPLELGPGWADVAVTLYQPFEAPAANTVEYEAGDFAAGGGAAAPISPAESLSPALLEPESPLAAGPLMAALAPTPAALAPDSETHNRVWRVVTDGRTAPAWVVGRLVHEALRHWALNLAASELEARLRPAAWELGLTEPATIRAALSEARRLLERLRAHSLFAEIDLCAERYHAVPCLIDGRMGTIDLLYRLPAGWTVVDFKTDELRDDAALAVVLPKYRRQLANYASALAQQLSVPDQPRALLVFLNLKGSVSAIPL